MSELVLWFGRRLPRELCNYCRFSLRLRRIKSFSLSTPFKLNNYDISQRAERNGGGTWSFSSSSVLPPCDLFSSPDQIQINRSSSTCWCRSLSWLWWGFTHSLRSESWWLYFAQSDKNRSTGRNVIGQVTILNVPGNNTMCPAITNYSVRHHQATLGPYNNAHCNLSCTCSRSVKFRSAKICTHKWRF